MQDPNPFEDSTVAREWISSIESEKSSSREEEIYPLLCEWSKDISPKTIVDLGCGQGICSSKIDLSSCHYIGIDPSELLLIRARELYPEINKTFVRGTAYNTGLDNSSVDAVFGIGVWFHLEDLDTAHQEIARITKPHGSLLIITSNPEIHDIWESWFIEYKREGKKIDGSVAVPSGVLSRNIFYLHSEEEIADSLLKNGYSIKSIKKIGFGTNRERDRAAWMVIEAIRT